MTVTRITEKNAKCFDRFLFKAAELSGGNIVKLGVIEDDTACGAAAFFIKGSVAELISLYVAPDFRRRGAASMLLRTFEEQLRGTGIDLMLASTLPTEQGLGKLLDRGGFVQLEGSDVYSFSFSEIKDLPALKKQLLDTENGSGCRFVSCEELRTAEQLALRDFLNKNRFSVDELCMIKFSAALSGVALREDGSVEACLLCSNIGTDVGIDLFLRESDDIEVLRGLCRCLYEALLARGEDDVQIFYLAVSREVIPFAEALLGDRLQRHARESYAVKLLPEAARAAVL